MNLELFNDLHKLSVDVKRVPKGWGFEMWYVNHIIGGGGGMLQEEYGYCGKLLYFTIGKRCSFHYHKNKHETFLVKRGSFRVILSPSDDPNDPEGYQTQLHQGSVLTIPPYLRHQMICNRTQDSEIIEFSTFHEDSDSYRVIKGD